MYDQKLSNGLAKAMRGDFPLFCEYLLAVTLIGRTVMGSRNCLAFVHSWLQPAPNPTLCLQKLPKVYRIQSTDTKSSTSLIVTPIVIQIVTIAFVHPSRCYNPALACKNAQYIPWPLRVTFLTFLSSFFNQDLSQDIYNKGGSGDDGDNEYLRWHTSSDWRWVDNAMFGAPQPPLPHCTVLHLLLQKSELHLASIANTSFYHSKPFQCKTAVRQIFFGKFYHVWKIWWNSNTILKRWRCTLEDLHLWRIDKLSLLFTSHILSV